MTHKRDGLLPGMQARPRADGRVSYRWKPHGKAPWVPLGLDLDDAIRKVLALKRGDAREDTLRWVWEHYRKHSPRWAKLGDGTRADYELAWKQLDDRLGDMRIEDITTKIVAHYVHVERASAKRRADVEKTLLSNVFKHAILTGKADRNPTLEVPPHGSEASTVLPQDAAIKRFLDWVAQQTPQRRVIALMARFAALGGNRRCEFLQVTKRQVDRAAGVIRTIRAKQRGKKREQVVEAIAITPPMAALLDEIEPLTSPDCPYLFVTRDGNPYTDRGFKTLWQRCWADALKAGVVTKEQRFTFHSLRAYYATQHKAQTGALPDLHANPAVTARVYDRSTVVKRSALK